MTSNLQDSIIVSHDQLRFVLSEFTDNLIRLALGRISDPYIYNGDTANKLYLNTGLYMRTNKSVLYVDDVDTFGTNLELELDDIVSNMLPAYKTFLVNILLRSRLPVDKNYYTNGNVFKFANNKMNINIVAQEPIFVVGVNKFYEHLLDVVLIETIKIPNVETSNSYDKVKFVPYDLAVYSTVKTLDSTTNLFEKETSRVNLVLYATPDAYNCAANLASSSSEQTWQTYQGRIKSNLPSLIVGGYNVLNKDQTYEHIVKEIHKNAAKFNLRKKCEDLAVLDSGAANKNLIKNLTPQLLNYLERFLAKEDITKSILFYTTPQGYMLMGSYCDATYFGYNRSKQYDQTTLRSLDIKHADGQTTSYQIDVDIEPNPDLLVENLVSDVKATIRRIKTRPEYISSLKSLDQRYITTYRLQNFLVINSPNGDQFDPTIAQAGSVLYLPRFISSSFVTNYSYERFTYANTFMFRIKLPIDSDNWIFLNSYSEYPTEREVMINKDCYYLVTNKEYLPIKFKNGYRDMLVFDLTLCDTLDDVRAEALHSGLDPNSLSMLNVKPSVASSGITNKFVYFHPYKEGRFKYNNDLESDMKSYEKLLVRLEMTPDRSIYFKEIVATRLSASGQKTLQTQQKNIPQVYKTMESVPASVAAMAGGRRPRKF
jgi:hypothetical protein